jgi:hypothetical protein
VILYILMLHTVDFNHCFAYKRCCSLWKTTFTFLSRLNVIYPLCWSLQSTQLQWNRFVYYFWNEFIEYWQWRVVTFYNYILHNNISFYAIYEVSLFVGNNPRKRRNVWVFSPVGVGSASNCLLVSNSQKNNFWKTLLKNKFPNLDKA